MSLLSAVKKKLHRAGSRSPAKETSTTQNMREKSGLFSFQHDAAVPESDIKVDIVAIHGLGGDWEQTWAHENGMLWLRDFLPLHLPYHARVFSYGYDSSTAFSKSSADIEIEAAMLIDRLQGKRTTQSEQSRPIIFIAHSLGGILVKKAMILANERPDHYEKLLGSVKASIFLAVPHRGSDLAFWAASAARLIKYGQLGFAGNTSYVKALQRNSSTCADISRQFVGRSAKLSIRTFFETERMGNQLVGRPGFGKR